ncbi:MAG: hypothetical protein CFE39_05460 [Comamonadaceae bacterium PBBC2]|nr:MAG: hypothetical protein CFE39_05460 [Comamonadaceae bacterium PBBC2]
MLANPMTSLTIDTDEQLNSAVQFLITSIRRNDDADSNWGKLEKLLKAETDRICAVCNTRWLTSICDTYVDFGNPIESRNGMMVSIFVKMEKIAQSYVHWRLGYVGSMGIPLVDSHRKIRLWDGVSSFNLEIGDATNSMFGRMEFLLSETYVLQRIFLAIKDRLAENDTILGNLNKKHRHVFDSDFSWILDDRYSEFRSSGRISPHRYKKFENEKKS